MKKQIIVTFKKNNTMKNKILIFSFLLFTCIFYRAQVPDTLAYAKQFEANKINYIGHPFSKLLNDMTQLQPKSIWSDTNEINTHRSGLVFNNMEDSFDIGTVHMFIFWQAPIPVTETEYYEKKNDFYFTNDERNFYGSKIVKDIYVRVTK